MPANEYDEVYSTAQLRTSSEVPSSTSQELQCMEHCMPDVTEFEMTIMNPLMGLEPLNIDESWVCVDNPNLHLVRGRSYHGLPLLSSRGIFIIEYLDRLIRVMNQACEEHPQTLAIRVELRLPILWLDLNLVRWDRLFKRFIQSLRERISSDQRRKQRSSGRSHPCTVRYVWARERSDEDRDHYHVLLLVNQEACRNLGSLDEGEVSLGNMIRAAWASALELDYQDGKGYVHFPRNCCYFINGKGDRTSYEEVFRRSSYLCKARTKVYDGSHQSFGYSRR